MRSQLEEVLHLQRAIMQLKGLDTAPQVLPEQTSLEVPAGRWDKPVIWYR